MESFIAKHRIAFADLMIIVLMIIISPETLLFGTNSIRIFLDISKYFPVFLFVLLFAKMQKGKSCSNKQFQMLITFWCVFSLCMFLSAVYNDNLIIGYGLRIIIMGAGFLFAVVYSEDKFMYIFEKILYVIALGSLVLSVFRFLIPALFAIFPTINNVQSYPFYNAFICVFPQWDYMFRLFGPFREPGVFQIYLNLALLFFIKLNGYLTFKRSIVYIAAIILTFSTTGYIVLLFTLLYYFFKNESKGSKTQKHIIIFFILSLIVILSLYTTLFSADSIVFGKLINFEESKSGIARFSSVFGNLSIFASSPIFGVGITNLPDMFIDYCYQHYAFANTSNTSTIFVPFATFGLLYGILWVILLISFFKSFSDKNISIICICIAGLLSFMGENLVENVLVYILIGYGILNLTTKIK